jgi:hypothetical protein
MSIFAGAPAAAHAADAEPVSVLSIGDGPYDLSLDSKTAKSGTGWSWDPAASTPAITIDSSCTAGSIQITAEDSLPVKVNLELDGDVEFDGNITATTSLTVRAESAAASLKLNDGYLYVVSETAAPNLIIDGVKLTASYINAKGALSIQNDSEVMLSGSDTGVIAGGKFNLTDSKLTTTGSGTGLRVLGEALISGSTLTATGGQYGFLAESGKASIDKASTLVIRGGKGYSALSVVSDSTVKPLEIKDIDSKVTLINATGLTGGKYFTALFKNSSGQATVWKVTPGSSFVDPSKSTTDSIAVKQVNETADIELLPVSEAEYYLAVKGNPASGGGTVTGGNDYFKAGESVNITATPNTAEKYLFGGWSSTGGGTFADPGSQSTTFTMPAGGATVTAAFPKKAKPGDVVKEPVTGKIYIDYAVVSAVADQAKTGKQIKPKLKVKLGGKSLTNGSSYTVTYGANKKVGEGTVTIKGKGNYTGSQVVKFKIVPKKTKISKVTPSKKKLKLTWKKVSGVTKYEIQYRVKNAKAWKKKTASAKSKSLTIKKLKKGKIYQVRIRSYQTVSGVKYYSAWSAVKKSKKIR